MALKGRKLSYQERWSHLNPPGKTAFAGPKGVFFCVQCVMRFGGHINRGNRIQIMNGSIKMFVGYGGGSEAFRKENLTDADEVSTHL